MRSRTHYIIFLPIFLTLFFGVLQAAKPRVSVANRMKSQHFSMLASEQSALGNAAEAHELYKRAYSLDTANLGAGLSYARSSLQLIEEDDTVTIPWAMSVIKRYIDAYPADYNEGQEYAYLCSLLGNLEESLRVLKRIYSIFPDKTELLPTIANQYMQLEQYDSALAVYNQYEQTEGFNGDITLRKTIAHMIKRDTTAALLESGAGIRELPQSATGYMLKAQLIKPIGYPDSVLYYLDLAEKTEPDNGFVKEWLAEYYKESGDSAMYQQKIFESLMAEDVDVESKLHILGEMIGDLLGEGGNLSMTDSLFRVLSRQYPHEPQIQDFGARYSYAKGDNAGAAEQVSFAIDMDPSNLTYRTQLVTYLLADGQYKKAVKAYEEMPENMQEGSSLLYLAAIAYRGDSLPQKSIDVAQKLVNTVAGIEMNDSVPAGVINTMSSEQLERISDGYAMIGDTYASIDSLAEAYAYYDRSLRFNPLNAMVLNNYAYFLAEHKGDYERARDMAQRAVTIEPDNATYVDTYAWTLFRMGEYKEALEQQRTAMSLMNKDTRSAEFYEHMGDILFMTGDPTGAVEMWKEALTLDSDSELLKKKIKHKTYFYE